MAVGAACVVDVTPAVGQEAGLRSARSSIRSGDSADSFRRASRTHSLRPNVPVVAVAADSGPHRTAPGSRGELPAFPEQTAAGWESDPHQDTAPSLAPSLSPSLAPSVSTMDGPSVAPGQLAMILDLAFSTHPELSRAAAAIDREDGNRHQATRWPNPVVGYMASEIGQGGQSGQQGIFWSQEWVTAGKLNLADQIGQWRVIAAEAGLEADRLRLSRRVQSQYWSLVAARQRVAVLTQLESLLGEAVSINEKLNQAAEVGRGTVLQARLEQSQVAIARRQAEINVIARTGMLAQTLGVAEPQIEAFGNDPWPTVTNQDSMSIQVASPELAEARALWESAKCEQRRADVEVIPNINTQASVQQDAISRDTIVGLQVGIALPITDRKFGLVQAARSEAARLQADLAARERQVSARVAEAVGQFETAQEMVQQIDTTLLEMARERLSLAQQAHEQGEIDYLELLLAQRSFLTIQQSAIDAHEQAAQARVRLETMVVEE